MRSYLETEVVSERRYTMKTVIIVLLLCTSLMAITAEDAAWLLDAETSLSKATQKAKKEHKKMVLLVVVRDGCDWCEKMVHETLRSEKIKKALSDTVVAVVDLSTPLPKGIYAAVTPTIFFIDAGSGRAVEKSIGYSRPGSFLIDIVSAKEKLP